LVSSGRYIAFHNARPRAFICSTLEGEGNLVGFVFKEDAIDEGSSARKAFSMLMVRGIYQVVRLLLDLYVVG